MRRLALWLCAVTCSAVVACPQQDPPGTTKDDEDVLKAGREDPYTENDPALMKQAGIVGYGPFPWADFVTTDDIERVLGKGRFLWMETDHFRIGLNFKTSRWPADQEKRKHLRAEIKELRGKLPKLPARPSKLGPWVRLHLYAHRLEKLYAAVQKMMGVTDADFGPGKMPPNGPYLGMGDKYLVLLFQKKSDLARYFERFCDQRGIDTSMRWYHQKTHQLVAAVAAEVLEGFDATATHAHVVYMATHNLFSGYRGFHVAMPMWFDEGLAHYYALDVPSDVANVKVLDSEAIPDLEIGAWPVKVRKRARHEGVCFTYEQMAQWQKYEELGYHAHSQAWSRVDFLMKRDAEKVAIMIKELKGIPPVRTGMVPHNTVETKMRKLLIELFEFDAETFDKEWRKYVLKTYPRK